MRDWGCLGPGLCSSHQPQHGACGLHCRTLSRRTRSGARPGPRYPRSHPFRLLKSVPFDQAVNPLLDRYAEPEGVPALASAASAEFTAAPEAEKLRMHRLRTLRHIKPPPFGLVRDEHPESTETITLSRRSPTVAKAGDVSGGGADKLKNPSALQ